MSKLFKNTDKKKDADNLDRWKTLDVDEFDGLVTLHGVLCAFLLSIAIELQGTTSYANQGRATFLGALAYHQDFRTFVHTVLNQTQPEYQWNVPVSNGVTVDLAGWWSTWETGSTTGSTTGVPGLARRRAVVRGTRPSFA